ncbi:MAG: pyruvate formate-lyase-activating protein [Victivallaceae bacterium]
MDENISSGIYATVGHLHSTESFGAVDGPGVRFVVFLQGCTLRCSYCHNPDSWKLNGGTTISAGDLTQKILSYRHFIRHGGVTFSGGEPLLQPQFLEAMIELLHQNSLHAAIDTAGSVPLQQSSAAIAAADLILLDIKSLDDQQCRELTGCGNAHTLSTLNYCEKIHRKVWIRHVLLPGFTLDYAKLTALANFLSRYKCIEKVELLPFHQYGKAKHQALNIPYTLSGIEPPSPAEVTCARQIFRAANFVCD